MLRARACALATRARNSHLIDPLGNQWVIQGFHWCGYKLLALRKIYIRECKNLTEHFIGKILFHRIMEGIESDLKVTKDSPESPGVLKRSTTMDSLVSVDGDELVIENPKSPDRPPNSPSDSTEDEDVCGSKVQEMEEGECEEDEDEEEEIDLEASDKVINVWVTKTPERSDTLPETPKRFRMRGFSRCKVRCVCSVMDSEDNWNGETATVFHNQLKHDDFQGLRKHLTLNETQLCSEFLIGTGTVIKLCLLKNVNLSTDERVVLMILSGCNEIRIPAFKFLQKGVELINSGVLYHSDHVKADNEMSLLDGLLNVEYYKDSYTRWIILKQLTQFYVAERIYMSAATWAEFRKIVPMIEQIMNFYIDLILQKRGCRRSLSSITDTPTQLN